MFHKISKEEARALVMASQFPKLPSNPLAAAQGALEHLGYVQIDTISVVERAHHHVLWSRLKDYQPSHLQRLVKEKRAFEYWSHAASYLPICDFRFSLPRKEKYSSGKSHWFTPTPAHKILRKKILARIHSEGPLQSRDFEAPAGKKSSGWFDWKPAKQVLDQLFMEGVLVISERRGFQKVYELAQRWLPADLNLDFPSEQEFARHLILRATDAHGLIRAEEISYLRRNQREQVKKEIRNLLKEGALQEVLVDGISKPYLINPLRRVRALPKLTRILSPFDNMVIQRSRMKDLFSFDYNIECYVPEKKRKFGYFCLPILEGNEFVGRVDAKAHRKENLLEIRSLHAQKKKDSLRRLETDFLDFAKFNGCSEILWPKK